MPKPDTVRIWQQAAGRLDDMALMREMQAADETRDPWKARAHQDAAKTLRDAAVQLRADISTNPPK